VYDYGVKRNILRRLASYGCTITVVPSRCSAEEVLALGPDGIFLSNGPGDPAAVDYAIENIRKLIGKKPIFGICLGHQLLALALGGKTFKLKFGHHGANHPVRNILTNEVEITSQNHGFAVDPASLDPGLVEITHVNLNDGTNEGFRHRQLPVFSVQYHPEASPGPHDSDYLFLKFIELMNEPSVSSFAGPAAAPKAQLYSLRDQ
jgi:carbamoyl-phosphate synthase small subunit